MEGNEPDASGGCRKRVRQRYTMQRFGKYLWIIVLLAGFGLCRPSAAWAHDDICAICGRPIQGTIYLMTDKVTGEKVLVCSDCIKLPLCSICGLPVKDNGVALPDGRHLCARDAKTVVLKAANIEQICGQVKDDLDRLFSRFTEFPANVDVTVIDRIDVDSMFYTEGNGSESPDLLGCIRPETVNDTTRYKMSLLIGMPLAQLKETCAHEYSHAWVGENVPKERRARLGRDAEEGFCEMVGYLLMDSQNEEVEKKRVLHNHYTRGQIDLFIEAEKTLRLRSGSGLDEIRRGRTIGTGPCGCAQGCQAASGKISGQQSCHLQPDQQTGPGHHQARRGFVGESARGHHQRPFLYGQ